MKQFLTMICFYCWLMLWAALATGYYTPPDAIIYMMVFIQWLAIFVMAAAIGGMFILASNGRPFDLGMRYPTVTGINNFMVALCIAAAGFVGTAIALIIVAACFIILASAISE